MDQENYLQDSSVRSEDSNLRTDNFDEFDYDTASTLQDSHSLKKPLKLSELEDGAIIETENLEPSEEKSTWWTKDELLRNLEDHPFGQEGEEELASFKDKIPRMETLVENRVWKRVIRTGTGPLITKKNAVLFHYNAYLDNSDEPFDSTVLRGKPFLNRLDQENMVHGLFVGILSMRCGEKAEILIDPEYGFGELGCPPRIPGDSYLLYIVEILKIYEEGSLQDYELMTPEELARVPFLEILSKCNQMRVSANTYFKDQRYREAGSRYRKAIIFLERYTYQSREAEKAAYEVLDKLYPNLAATYIRLKKLPPAMGVCRKALSINEKNIKALFNYGKAKFLNADYDEARDYYVRALTLDPSNRTIIEWMQKLEKRVMEDERVTRELYKNMGEKFFSQ